MYICWTKRLMEWTLMEVEEEKDQEDGAIYLK